MLVGNDDLSVLIHWSARCQWRTWVDVHCRVEIEAHLFRTEPMLVLALDYGTEASCKLVTASSWLSLILLLVWLALCCGLHLIARLHRLASHLIHLRLLLQFG